MAYITKLPPQTPKREIIYEMPLEYLYPPRYNAFGRYTEDCMWLMVEFTKRRGISDPILTRPTEKGYEIVDGVNRVEAARQVGLETIPAIVRDMDEKEAMEVRYDINRWGRKEWSPEEKAKVFKISMDAFERFDQKQKEKEL